MQNSGWISYITDDAMPMQWRTSNGLLLTRTRIHIVLRPRHTRASDSVPSSFPNKSSFVHARTTLISSSRFLLFASEETSERGKERRQEKSQGQSKGKKGGRKVRRWLERWQMLCGGQEEDPRPPPSNAKKTAEAAAGSHI